MTEQILSASSSDLSNWLNELTKKLKDIPAEGDDGRSSDEIISSLFSSGDSVSISTEAKAALAELLSQMRGEKANLGLNDGQRIQFTEEDCIAYVSQRSTELQDQMAKKMAEFSAPDIDWMLGMAPIESTTQSGHKISVYAEQYEDNGELKTQMMARVDKTDGQSLLYQIMGNSVFSEDENGNVILRTTQHGLFLSDNSLTGSSGNDVIISFSAHTIEGGDGDDTIILLNNKFHSNDPHVDAGAGDDRLIANEIHSTYSTSPYKIDMGDGDDTIHANVVKGIIDMGAGDDTIIANEISSGRINMGDGDNTLRVRDYTAAILTAGDGNNTFDLGDFISGKLALGKGLNKVMASRIGYTDLDKQMGRNYFARLNWQPDVTITSNGPTEIMVAGDVRNVKFNGSMSVFATGDIDDVEFEGSGGSIYVLGEIGDNCSFTGAVSLFRPNGENVTSFEMNLMNKKFKEILDLYEAQN